MSKLPTSALWQATNVALLARNFVQARAGLDELTRRPDHVDMFATPQSYTRHMPPAVRTLIEDRVALANAVAERNAYVGRRMWADADFGSGVPAGWEG